MIKAVFFDLDGTLIKSMDDHFYSWNHILNQYKNVSIDKNFFLLTEGTKLKILVKKFFINKKKKCTLKEIEQLIFLKDQYYKLNFKVKFYPKVKSLIKFLLKKNILLYIVTSGSKRRVFRTLPKNFINLFENIITGDDCAKGKPSPEQYLTALKLSKIDRKNCLAIENSPLGILSAKKAKIKTIAITNTLTSKYLNKADKVIKSIEEIKQFI